MLSVGARRVEPAQAQSWITKHAESGINGWPNYDWYESGTDGSRLAEADLLAPALLNVPITLATFPGLKQRLPELNEALSTVPADAALTTADAVGDEVRLADEDDLIAAAQAFAVLDYDRPPGVRLTKLAKVLHRKRPRLLPLYDRYVRACYCFPDGDRPAVITPTRGRSYVAFVTLLLHAMRHDLNNREWSNLELPAGMTALRALDVVAWHVGQRTVQP